VNDDLTGTETRGSITAGLAQLQRGDLVADIVARADSALYEQRYRKVELANTLRAALDTPV
jgi:hypothetical protein